MGGRIGLQSRREGKLCLVDDEVRLSRAGWGGPSITCTAAWSLSLVSHGRDMFRAGIFREWFSLDTTSAHKWLRSSSVETCLWSLLSYCLQLSAHRDVSMHCDAFSLGPFVMSQFENQTTHQHLAGIAQQMTQSLERPPKQSAMEEH
jgi:hypothetical protein